MMMIDMIMYVYEENNNSNIYKRSGDIISIYNNVITEREI